MEGEVAEGGKGGEEVAEGGKGAEEVAGGREGAGEVSGGGESEGGVQSFDDLLDHLGAGPWSLLYYVAVATYHGSLVGGALGGAFVTPLQDYTCRLPSSLNNQSSLPGIYTTSNPSTAIVTPIDECHYYVTSWNGTRREEKCTQWDFDHSTFGDTITSEMSLVCDRAFLVPLYQSTYMFGCAFGAWTVGLLSDRIGRRPIFVWSAVLYVLVGSGSAFFTEIYVILVPRFALGVIHSFGIQSGYVLLMETVPSRLRAVAGMIVVLPWAISEMVYGGLGYVIRQWRYLQIAASLPFVLYFPMVWYLDESPRWLLVRGEVGRAHEVLKRAARMNKVDPPTTATLNTVYHNIQRENEKEKTTRSTESPLAMLRRRVLEVLVLFRTAKLRMLTLVVCTTFFTASMVYYGLSLSGVNFSSNPYVYMVLSGLSEIPSYTLTGPILSRLGRKGPAIFCFSVTGLALVVLPFLSTELEWVRVTLAMVGKVCISTVFVELFLYSSEVFPTEVRLLGLGTGLSAARSGSIVSPFINDSLVPLYPWITSVAFGGMSLVAALATCLLPETRGARMPDVVADVETKKHLLPHAARGEVEAKV